MFQADQYKTQDKRWNLHLIQLASQARLVYGGWQLVRSITAVGSVSCLTVDLYRARAYWGQEKLVGQWRGYVERELESWSLLV
jgi:hypothetical protein